MRNSKLAGRHEVPASHSHATLARDALQVVAAVALAATWLACADPDAPPAVVVGEGGRWELLAPLAQGPRQETAVVALAGEVVVLGGFDALGSIVTRVEAYDPVGARWRLLPDLPTPMHHANIAVVDGALVIAGFLVGADFSPDGRTFVMDAGALAWRAGARMTDAAERGASGVTVVDGAVFVFGGTAGGSSARVSRYDVGADAWTELDDLPRALDHLGAATLPDGERVIIVGGRTNGLGNHTGDVLTFDPASVPGSGAFEERAPMPTSRAGFGLSVVGDELFVVGGEGNGDVDTGVFPQAQAYDPARDAWRSVVDMRTPRHGMGATTIEGALYVPGGADREGFAAVDTFERFVLE